MQNNAATQNPMYLYIELSDMVITLEDYYKVFAYLGFDEILLSNKATFAGKSQPKVADVYGSFDICFDKKFTCTNCFKINRMHAFKDYSAALKWLEFRCGDFYIYGIIGSRHIIVCHKDDVRQGTDKEDSVFKKSYGFYNELNQGDEDKNLFCDSVPYYGAAKGVSFYGYTTKAFVGGGPEFNWVCDDSMHIKAIFNDGKLSYGVWFGNKRKTDDYWSIDSTKLPKSEFLALLKAKRQEWRAKVDGSLYEGVARRTEWLKAPFKEDLESKYPLSSVRIKLPDNLLSC